MHSPAVKRALAKHQVRFLFLSDQVFMRVAPSSCSNMSPLIWEFIAADSLDAADRVLEELYEAISSLVAYPQIGHILSDLTSRPVRFHPCEIF
jgi:hypothetical protein